MRKYGLEELRAMDDRDLDLLVDDVRGRKMPVPFFTTDLNAVTAAVREWCGDFGVRPQMFVQALAEVLEVLRVRLNIHAIITLGYRFATATARDLSMALVLAAQGEGE